MIAVDTNILVRAHRKDLPQHIDALRRLTLLAEGNVAWGLPVFCLGEFLRVVTHPKIFDPPSSVEEALQAIAAILDSSAVRVLSPGPRYPALLADCIRTAHVRGNLVFDAQIAALCREHSVEKLLTLDRDLSRFPGIQTIGLSEPSDSPSPP